MTELTPVQTHIITNLIPKVSGQYAASFRGYVDRDDIDQELTIWVWQHPRKLQTWVQNDDGDSISDRMAVRALSNLAKQYCMSQKAKREGFSAADQFYYTSREDLKVVLEATLARPSGDGPWIDALMDCQLAFDGLPAEHREMLVDVHLGGLTQRELATGAGVARSTISKRYESALRALHDALGGHQPQSCAVDCECGSREWTGTRTVMSNATAVAISNNNYEEN